MIDIKIGDCRDLIKDVPNESINCVITSPPYWGLRDYGHSDQIGQEETPEDFIKTLVDLFADIKNKLIIDGNCFVNLGDTYASNTNLPAKCMCMIPERFAWGMIQNGWILRNKIVWYKPNHMPDSAQDRLTKAYKIIYHFVKSKKYYYDLDAIREPCTSKNRMRDKSNEKYNDSYIGGYFSKGIRSEQNPKGKNPGDVWEINTESVSSPRARTQRKSEMLRELCPGINHGDVIGCNSKGKNPGDVWEINTKPYRKAHFATYPLELIRRPILAGCPKGGIVLDPFGGSGTTGEFCRKNNRNCILFELNEEYKPLIIERTQSNIPLLMEYT